MAASSRNSSFSATRAKCLRWNFAHAATSSGHPRESANRWTPRTLCAARRRVRNSAQASLTRDSCRKEAPSIRDWTLSVLMDTLPLRAT